ncbi:MAG: TIGR01244 family sulfur transferase [Croceibacterium sp.]
MHDFRKLSEGVLASPQLTLADVETALSEGVKTIINNRPEGEAADQVPGRQIEAAARKAGMNYVSIPIRPGEFTEEQVQAMVDALSKAGGKILAYCRTGTRSTLLWALAQAKSGVPIETIASAAASAGYDVSPIMPALIAIAEQATR